jgi:arginine decarboxylase
MIRVVWGDGSGRTAKASFDAALAAAGLHQYNLRKLSSVIPADAALDVVGTAPDLGPTGGAVDAVVARQTSQPGARAAAGLAWVRGPDGTGVFYEVGDHDPETVEELLQTGIERGCALRGLDPAGVRTEVITADPAPDRYTTAVVLAVYGESDPLV